MSGCNVVVFHHFTPIKCLIIKYNCLFLRSTHGRWQNVLRFTICGRSPSDLTFSSSKTDLGRRSSAVILVLREFRNDLLFSVNLIQRNRRLLVRQKQSVSCTWTLKADCPLLSGRDLMDRLVDEAEGLVDGSASVCSSSSGRIEPPTEQQLNLLNSITASDLSGILLLNVFRHAFTF